MSATILLLLARPLLEHSSVNARLRREAAELPFVTGHDLYERDPTLALAPKREQALLVFGAVAGPILAGRFLVRPRLTTCPARAHDEIVPEGNPVEMAGFGRFGRVTGRVRRASGVGATVLDLDPSMVELLRRLELKVHHGDAARPALLHAAGCAHAKLFVLAVDELARSVEIAATVRRIYPNLPILARARNRTHYYELKRLGIEVGVRETMGSALELAAATLRGLGVRAHTAERLTRRWREHDEEALHALAALWGGDEATYFAAAKQALADAGVQRKAEVAPEHALRDTGWDAAPLREAAGAPPDRPGGA